MRKYIIFGGVSLAAVFLGIFLIFLLILEDTMVEPKIIKINQEINVIGLMTRTTEKTVYKDLPKIYSEYMSIKANNGIKNMKSPWEYISLSTNFEGIRAWDYYTGHIVDSYEGVSEKLVKFSVPAGTYAVFPIKCKYKIFFGLNLGRMKQYIYKKWLPNSGYEFAGYEYEYNNEAMYKVSPYNVDLYVGIKKK